MRIDFEPENAAEALQNARAHVARYHRQHCHDAGAFRLRARRGLHGAREVTRAELRDRKTSGIRDAGIYLIVAENGTTLYVGLAADFYARFNTGRTAHTDDCPPGCGHYGHFVDPTTGSAEVGMPDGDCRFFLLETLSHDGFAIQQAEIDWYFLFLAHGWAGRGARCARRLTNDPSRLGAKGRETAPCIVLLLETGEYRYYVSQMDAQEDLGVPSNRSVLGPTISQHKNQQNGYTARHATPDEASLGEVASERAVVWREGEASSPKVDLLSVCPGCRGEGKHRRNLRLYWDGGRLTDKEIEHLNANRRTRSGGAYKKELPQSEYRGVRWHSTRGGWQCGVRNGPRSNDLNQYGPKKSWRSDDDAALHREQQILERGLEEFNRGRTGSNAKLLNERLSRPQRGGVTFVDWEEQ